jgi:hypothetical protein
MGPVLTKSELVLCILAGASLCSVFLSPSCPFKLPQKPLPPSASTKFGERDTQGSAKYLYWGIGAEGGAFLPAVAETDPIMGSLSPTPDKSFRPPLSAFIMLSFSDPNSGAEAEAWSFTAPFRRERLIRGFRALDKRVILETPPG